MEAKSGWEIISAEVTAFQNLRAGRAAVPAVRLLREHAERLRDKVLEEVGADGEKATRLLISRLLHDPSITLRNAASGAPGELEALDRAVRKLFQLEGVPSQKTNEKKEEDL